jgi:hypothetical protein
VYKRQTPGWVCGGERSYNLKHFFGWNITEYI